MLVIRYRIHWLWGRIFGGCKAKHLTYKEFKADNKTLFTDPNYKKTTDLMSPEELMQVESAWAKWESY